MDKINIRLLLLPLSWIYAGITSLRNLCFDLGIFSAYNIPNKSIIVGNLSTGGTGKTPHVDLISNILLSQDKKVAILSRGYGRIKKGVREVLLNSTTQEVGDEPLFYKLKYQEKIKVVVAEERKLGVKHIQKNHPDIDVILLDDAFQHRAVNAGLNILISDYSKPFYSDFVLPAGNLRELRKGKRRAQAIIISKCPSNISNENKSEIIRKIKHPSAEIFFSQIEYGMLKPFSQGVEKHAKNILLVTGIGNPKPLVEFLYKKHNVEHLRFKDHHTFTSKDIAEIHQKFDTFVGGDKIIVTTEKDFMRLQQFNECNSSRYPWFYQPINTKINKQEKFKTYLNGYVSKI